MEVPFKSIQEGLASIGNFFTDLLSYLNPFHENFIFRNFFANVGTILDYINPFSDNFFLKSLLDFLGTALSYINPFSENFFVYKLIELLQNLLELLFVPQTNPFDELWNKFNEKFAFIEQIKKLANSLLGFNNYGDSVPSFEMTWKGVTFAIIDFSLFLDYRLWLHGIILAIAWFIFIRKTFNKLPSIIGGFGR